MARELLVMRHAKSDWDVGEATDLERPLASRGKRDAPRMAAWMEANEVAPDLVTCSPARRAASTAARVVQALPTDPSVVQDERLYLASVPTLLEVLSQVPREARRVLLVAHNPGLEELVQHLAAETRFPDEGRFFPTATVALLELPDDWGELSRRCGRLVALVRPRDLSGA